MIDDLIIEQDNRQAREQEQLERRSIRYIEKIEQERDKYKQAWKELYEEREKPCGIEYMQDLEQKYNIGSDE